MQKVEENFCLVGQYTNYATFNFKFKNLYGNTGLFSKARMKICQPDKILYSHPVETNKL